jgi:hypothetical protein
MATTQMTSLPLPPISDPCEPPMSLTTDCGVFCIHCGSPLRVGTPLERLAGHVSLIWCRMCLREAPYRAEDLVAL